VAGISFVGTSRAGRIIATCCAETGKRFAALPPRTTRGHVDAKVDDTLQHDHLLHGAAGQR
jgi:acyl-CoA reductase-like NAD-dependent aldehyde dehydrogenase